MVGVVRGVVGQAGAHGREHRHSGRRVGPHGCCKGAVAREYAQRTVRLKAARLWLLGGGGGEERRAHAGNVIPHCLRHARVVRQRAHCAQGFLAHPSGGASRGAQH